MAAQKHTTMLVMLIGMVMVSRGIRTRPGITVNNYRVMGGDVLAEFEELQGNVHNMSLKHHMIAVRGGEDGSLSKIREYYKNGYATKHDYAKALQCYQSYLDEIKKLCFVQ